MQSLTWRRMRIWFWVWFGTILFFDKFIILSNWFGTILNVVLWCNWGGVQPATNRYVLLLLRWKTNTEQSRFIIVCLEWVKNGVGWSDKEWDSVTAACTCLATEKVKRGVDPCRSPTAWVWSVVELFVLLALSYHFVFVSTC